MKKETEKPRKMPRQKRGESKQDYQTPKEFIKNVERVFGVKFVIDLAAVRENTVARRFISPARDSLKQDWYKEISNAAGAAWLNPPFGDIGPWAKKCNEYLNRCRELDIDDLHPIFFLTPASVGSNWFQNYVHDNAKVNLLSERIQFVGAKWVYPKDCILSVFGYAPGYNCLSFKAYEL